MGKGGQLQEKEDKETRSKGDFSWKDIKLHTSKQDRWIVIDGQVYDVTSWSNKHPGGPKLIGHYAGQDASEAFSAFHNNLDHVKKYLKPLHVGSVKDYVEADINTNFKQLKQTATKMGLFQPSVTFYVMSILQLLLLEALAYYTLVWFGTGWIPFITSILLYATMHTQAGWIAHDYGHLSVFHSSKLDYVMECFVMGFIKGASASWWNHLHFQHHAKPNVIDKDPDVRLDIVFVVGDEQPVQVAKSRKASMPFNFQHRYFFAIGPPLLFPVYFQYMWLRYELTRKLWKEFALTLAFSLRFCYMFGPLLGAGWTAMFYLCFKVIESHWFVWVTQSNHIPMTIKADEENPWLKLQMHATCDIEQSVFNDWFTGHLNFQIEHHLFPTMPRHNLYKIAPLVKSLCEKHNVPYVVKPLLQSFKDIVRSLKSSGEIWKEAYADFHTK